jgi:flagellar biosynthesis protein FliQ
MGAHLATNAVHEEFRKSAMTNKQRLMYSILIALSVLAIMLGLSHLQTIGVITEKTFQYIAIFVAIMVVVLNGFMRRKVKR